MSEGASFLLYWRASALWACCCALLAGCSAQSPGTFSVRFEFRDGVPDADPQLYAFARVERMAGGGKLKVAQAQPRRFEPGVRLDLPDVPNGRDYRVFAELKTSEEDAADALYYGSSELFAVQPGEHREVKVALSLRPVPSVLAGTSGLRIVEAVAQPQGLYVASEKVTLALDAREATRVVVANDAALSRGKQTRLLDSLELREGERIWPHWDLDAEVCDAPTCLDGRREVFVVFENDSGYRSPPSSLAVNLDRNDPGISSPRIDPTAATDGDRVSVFIIANEALSREPELRVEPPDFDFVLQPGSDDTPGGIQFTFGYTVDARAIDRRRYNFVAHLVDLAGNAADVLLTDTTLEITGELAALSSTVERAPAFASFDALPYFSRNDAVNGEPVRAVVRVESNVPYRAEPAPKLFAEDAAGQRFELLFAPRLSSERVAVFEHAFSARDRAGDYGLRLEWVDTAGRNGRPRVDRTLQLRDPPPTAAFGSVDMGVAASGEPHTLYTARPWGEYHGGEHQTVPDSLRGRVRQRARSREDCIAQVLIYADADASGAPRASSFLGVANVEGVTDGKCETTRATFAASLQGNRDARLIVVPVSASGYAGAAQVVQHGEWVAALPPGVVGGTPENPHRLVTHVRAPTTALAAGDVTALPADSGDARNDATWERRIASAARAPHGAFALTYDAGRGRVLAVGAGADDRAEVAAWDGASWTAFEAIDRPIVDRFRSLPAVYDAARDRLVMLVWRYDATAASHFFDVWEWDGQHWSMQEPARRPTGEPRYAVYDASRQRVVLAVDWPSRIWEWNGAEWSEGEPLPGNYDVEAAAHDPHRNSLFTLVRDIDTRQLVTLEYRDRRWSELSTGSELMGLGDAWLDAPSLQYDPQTRSMLLWNPAATWRWDGATWSPLPQRTLPELATFFVSDTARAGFVALSGWNPDERWQFDGSTFAQTAQPSAPSVLRGPRLVYDTGRQRLMLFGTLPDYWKSSLLELVDGRWQRPNATVGFDVPGRLLMAYDAARERTVLLNSIVNESTDGVEAFASETAVYDGASWSTVANDPALLPRTGYALSYDPSAAQVVLFGGALLEVDVPEDDAPRLDDTWLWDGSTWREQRPAVAPTARLDARMCQDVLLGASLLFGGAERDADFFALAERSDTWRWDGRAWQQLSPLLSPPKRSKHAMVFDEARQRVVLFGGETTDDDGVQSKLSDTWEWDGTSWSEVKPAVSPPPRADHAMAFDAERGRVVMYGGVDNLDRVSNARVLNDFWEWDGTTWVERTQDVVPRGRFDTALAYHADAREVVMFGGRYQDGEGMIRLDDTWIWNGSTWQGRNAVAGPDPLFTVAMGYDPTERLLRLVGAQTTRTSTGIDRRLETWELASSVWRQRDGVGFTAVDQRGVLFDTVRNESLLVGPGETRRWTDDGWQLMAAAGGPAGALESVVFDTREQRGVALTTPALLQPNEAWVWRDDRWTREPALDPGGRGMLVFDTRREQLTHIAESAPNRASVLEPNGWRELRTTVEPGLMEGARATFDAARDQSLLVGTSDLDSDQLETWLLSRADPAHGIDIDLTSLVGSARTPDVLIDGLTFRAISGATAGSQPGSELAVWSSALGYRTVVDNAAPHDAPAALCFNSADPATLGQLEIAHHLYFRVRPHTAQASSGATPTVSTTAAELRVRYHMPGAAPATPAQPHTLGAACDDARWLGDN
jgi:hypothetical protein